MSRYPAIVGRRSHNATSKSRHRINQWKILRGVTWTVVDLHHLLSIPLREPPFNLQWGETGFRGWTNIFFHYNPAYIFFFQLLGHQIIYFIFTLKWTFFFPEGNYLFQQLAATNYLFYHLFALNYLFKKIISLPPPGD